MRVLLLHPDDDPERFLSSGPWGLIIDLGRAPSSTYEGWRKSFGASVLCLSDLAHGMEDMRRLREVFHHGVGVMVDRHGIDWWEIVKLNLVYDFLQISLLQRLTDYIASSDKVFVSRKDFRAEALAVLTGRNIQVAKGSKNPGRIRRESYWRVLRDIGAQQFAQVVRDKFDTHHDLRRRFARRNPLRDDLVLLPSAYINVSLTAAEHARRNPQSRFLMMYARASAALSELPANVMADSLDGYFSSPELDAIHSLLEAWQGLKARLIETVPEFAAAERAGVLRRIPSALKLGIRVRDAWRKVFMTHQIVGCFSSDDNNVYTRLPLVLAQKAGIPALTNHHGALDCFMAVKEDYGVPYLAKTTIERDYLLRKCWVAKERIVMSVENEEPIPRTTSDPEARCFTFFSEPYGLDSWRAEAVYADMLPRLVEMTREAGLRLVCKVHPFESARGFRRLLLRHLTRSAATQIEVIEGTMTESRWLQTKVAMTVESSIAVECARRNLPIFLCGWLKAPFYEYQSQFIRFGAGYLLEKVEDIARIPELLENVSHTSQRSTPFAPADWACLSNERGAATHSGV